MPSFMGTVNENENRSKISIQAVSKEETEHLYNHLSDGGIVEIPLEKSPLNQNLKTIRTVSQLFSSHSINHYQNN